MRIALRQAQGDNNDVMLRLSKHKTWTSTAYRKAKSFHTKNGRTQMVLPFVVWKIGIFYMPTHAPCFDRLSMTYALSMTVIVTLSLSKGNTHYTSSIYTYPIVPFPHKKW
jgi:hypothetical protein